MRCEDALVAVSSRADGELPPADGDALDTHLAVCDDCRRFVDGVAWVRSSLRVEPVGRAPDIGPAVVALARAEPRQRRGRVAVAAAVAAVAGLVAGATFVGIGSDGRSPAAADVPARVLAAQDGITAVDGRYTVSEPQGGGGRTFEADLTYRAPESLALRVQETTAGAAPAERSDGALVVDADRWWHEATRQCSPAAGLVRCPAQPLRWSRSVTGREPFSDDAPVPLELVSPVDGFALSAPPTGLGHRTIAGHEAVGVSVTAAQVAGLLDGLSAAVELRPVHPTDPVELWLEEDHFVPLALVVRAAGGPERAAWATSAAVDDVPGDVVLRVDATDVRINDPDDPVAAPAEGADEAVDVGFRAAPEGDPVVSEVPEPQRVPAGFAAYRRGVVSTPGGPSVGVRSWSDGRAWFAVRATAQWPGGRLFGSLGADVRPVDLGAAGTGYASGDGQQVAVHTGGLDVVVRGSLPSGDIRDIAADLGIVGVPVPDDWAEATSASDSDAMAALPGLLTAGPIDGFGPPAFRVTGPRDDVSVTEARSGPGDRAFTLTQWRSASLVPPSAGDEVATEVRGAAGRYSPQRGELEWVESGLAVSLGSDTLGLADLLDIARGLEPS